MTSFTPITPDFAEVKKSMTLMFEEKDYVPNVTDTTNAGPFAPSTLAKYDKRVEGDLAVGDPMPDVNVFVPTTPSAGDGGGGGDDDDEPAAKRAKTGNGASSSSSSGGRGGGGGDGGPRGAMVPLSSLRHPGRPLVLTFGSFS